MRVPFVFGPSRSVRARPQSLAAAGRHAPPRKCGFAPCRRRLTRARSTSTWAALLFKAFLIAAPQLHALDLGDGPVLLIADRVEYDTEANVVTASGNVEVTRGERRLLADTLRYDQDTDLMEAEGNVALLEPTGDTLFADRVVLSGDLREGVAEQLRARLVDNSLLAARGGRRTGGVRTELDRAVFSPCPLCPEGDEPPLWRLTARRVIHDQERQNISYRHAFLELYGVPIAYLPYFTHPDPTVERRSGFLAPSFGNDGILGLSVQPFYYFAPAPNYDVTLAPIFYTRENPVLTVEYRHLLESGSFQFNGSGTYASKPIEQEGDPQPSGNTFRGAIEGHGRFRLPDQWQSGFDLDVASDDTYLQRYGFSDDNVLTSRLFAERFWERDFLTLNAYGFQGLREDDDQELIPIALPLARAHVVSEPWRWGSRFHVDTSAVALTRTGGLDTRRVSTTGGWQLPWYGRIGDRYDLQLSMRGDFYQTDGDPQTFEENGSGTEGRVIPRATLHWSWPFIGELFGLSQVIEPVAMASWATTGNNDDDIPNEDSQDLEFDDTSLFEPNRFPGLDRVQGGTSLAYGLRFGTYGQSGLFSGLIGQAYSFDKDPEFDPSTGLDTKLSDYVGRIDFSPGEWLDATYRFRLDREDLDFVRNEVGVSLGPREVRFGIDYLMLRDDPALQVLRKREEITADLWFRVSDSLALGAQTRRNLEADTTIFHRFGLVYTHPCLQFVAGVERRNTNDRDAEDTTTFSFRVTLKHLGEIGAEADVFGGGDQ
jgi:LPS-assembly protein